jgi:nitrogen fixation protein NifU and related proteins
MHIFNDPMVMRQVIMDHYEHPRNRRIMDGQDVMTKHLHSSGCIDDIHLYIKVKDQRVIEVSFEGVACTISTASTSMLTEIIVNKTIDEALVIIKNYENMLYSQPFDETLLGEAIVLKNTSKQASRIKCALIGWQGAQQIFMEEEKHG